MNPSNTSEFNPYTSPPPDTPVIPAVSTKPWWVSAIRCANIILKSGAYFVLTLQCAVLAGLVWMTVIKILTGKQLSHATVVPAGASAGCIIGMITIPCYLYYSFRHIHDQSADS